MADSPLESLRGWLLQADQGLAMFYEIPDGVEVPEHAHGAQWGVVLEGSVEFTIGGRDEDLPAWRHLLRAGLGRPQRGHLTWLRRHRRLRGRESLRRPRRLLSASDELAGVDEQRAPGHEEREVGRAEEDDARDVVGHCDAAERQLSARAPPARSRPTAAPRAVPRDPESRSPSERRRARGCRGGRARPRVPG